MTTSISTKNIDLSNTIISFLDKNCYFGCLYVYNNGFNSLFVASLLWEENGYVFINKVILYVL